MAISRTAACRRRSAVDFEAKIGGNFIVSGSFVSINLPRSNRDRIDSIAFCCFYRFILFLWKISRFSFSFRCFSVIRWGPTKWQSKWNVRCERVGELERERDFTYICCCHKASSVSWTWSAFFSFFLFSDKHVQVHFYIFILWHSSWIIQLNHVHGAALCVSCEKRAKIKMNP